MTIHMVRIVFVMLTLKPMTSWPVGSGSGWICQTTCGGGNSSVPLMKQTG